MDVLRREKRDPTRAVDPAKLGNRAHYQREVCSLEIKEAIKTMERVLSEEDQELVLLRLEGNSYKEMAVALGWCLSVEDDKIDSCSVRARKRYSRAMRILQRAVAG